MRILIEYAELVARLLRPFSLCAHVGAIHGAIVGGMMGLFLLGRAHGPMSAAQVVQGGVILALFAWVITLVVLCAWERYSLRSVAVPTLLLALLTSLPTVFLTKDLAAPLLAFPTGGVVGLFWGEALCRLCDLSLKARLEKPNAMPR
jgi:hypothetical protein